MFAVKSGVGKEWRLSTALLLVNFIIYSFYFYPVFLNINSILSSITLDSIKNYYTFVYHVKNDSSLLHFAGMNYPLGEHVIYTDCQPILTFLLRLLPFTHNHLIGIMHSLLFFSFIITPLILHRIFILLSVNRYASFFASIAIGLLSPQFLKINGGHHALAYGCMIPIAIFLILKYFKYRTLGWTISLWTYSILSFLLHPYMGFSICIFAFMAIFIYDLTDTNKKGFKLHVTNIIANLSPILLFKIFMSLTDSHQNRTKEPYGSEVMVENIDSLLAPVYGPFKGIMEHLFNHRTEHYEGHTYLGFFTILLSLVLLFSLPLIIKKKVIKREVLVIFISGTIILLISFGCHTWIMERLNVKISAVSQFRAVCRFAWYFYFCFTILLVTTLYDTFRFRAAHRKIVTSAAILYFTFNLFEAHYLFKLDEAAYWKFRNVFNADLLNKEERLVLKNIKQNKPQAILPLPLFHGGSEMYDRNGASNSMLPSMIYSYHSGLPIVSVMMSRTSMSETENLIEILNSYKKDRKIVSLLNQRDFLVLKTNDALLSDEKRLLPYITPVRVNDTILIGSITRKDLFKRKVDSVVYKINSNLHDSSGIKFISYADRKPFLKTNMDEFVKLYELDSNAVRDGNYILSFHYHYTEKVFQSLSIDMIVAAGNKEKYEWLYSVPLRKMSGFYFGFGVFEYPLRLEKGNRYEFILKGLDSRDYKVSNFLLRPDTISVFRVTGKDTVFNNFPSR